MVDEVRPWKPGMPLSPEQKEKRRQTMANKRGTKSAGGARPQPVKRAPSQPRQAAPSRSVSGISGKLLKRIEDLVGLVVGLGESGTMAIAKKITVVDEEKNEEGKVIRRSAPRRAYTDEAAKADALEEWEREMIAEALTSELLRYPKVRDLLIKAVEVQDRGTLPTVIALVAMPRMIRHGLLPGELEEIIKGMREAARKARASGRRSLIEPVPTPSGPPPATHQNGNGAGLGPSAEELERELAGATARGGSPDSDDE